MINSILYDNLHKAYNKTGLEWEKNKNRYDLSKYG